MLVTAPDPVPFQPRNLYPVCFVAIAATVAFADSQNDAVRDPRDPADPVTVPPGVVASVTSYCVAPRDRYVVTPVAFAHTLVGTSPGT